MIQLLYLNMTSLSLKTFLQFQLLVFKQERNKYFLYKLNLYCPLN